MNQDPVYYVSLHEAGHALVCARFHIPFSPAVRLLKEWPGCDGIVQSEKTSPENNSVCGWAGAVTTWTGRPKGAWRRAVAFPAWTAPPLEAVIARSVVRRSPFADGCGEASIADMRLVNLARKPFATARTAFDLVQSNLDELFTLADALYEGARLEGAKCAAWSWMR